MAETTGEATPREPERRTTRARRGPGIATRPLLFTLGGYHLALGAYMALAPKSFFDQIATYGAYNDHYIRDVATLYLALGGVMLVAAVRRSWQVPVLAFTLAQYALHEVNHLIDIGDTDPAGLGFLNAIVLAIVLALSYWLYRGVREASD